MIGFQKLSNIGEIRKDVASKALEVQKSSPTVLSEVTVSAVSETSSRCPNLGGNTKVSENALRALEVQNSPPTALCGVTVSAVKASSSWHAPKFLDDGLIKVSENAIKALEVLKFENLLKDVLKRALSCYKIIPEFESSYESVLATIHSGPGYRE